MCFNLPRHRYLPPATWRVRTGRSVRVCHFTPSELVMQQNLKPKRKQTPAKTFRMLKEAYENLPESQTRVFE